MSKRLQIEIMSKGVISRVLNRLFHLLARHGPGATNIRPFLHRLRGVKVEKNVFIGDEVYLENEYPETVEIQSGVQISVRAVLIAHTRGAGRIIIEKDVFIGPNVVLLASSGHLLRIGEGAVIGAGVIVTTDVAPRMLVTGETARAVATASIPFTRAETMNEFIRGLVPIVHRKQSPPTKSD